MFRHSIFNKRTNLYQKYPFNSPLTFLFGGIKNNSFLDTNTNQNVTTFDKKIPISSYLVAFVAGELEYGKMSERCGVWTEIGLCQKAYHEFKDAEKYIQIAEEYFNHPYEQGNSIKLIDDIDMKRPLSLYSLATKFLPLDDNKMKDRGIKVKDKDNDMKQYGEFNPFKSSY